MREIHRTAIVEHSAPRLYALVEDVAAYPRFLPWCLHAQVHEREASGMRATLQVGMRGIRQAFTTRTENHPPGAIAIYLVEGPFRHFEAHWQFMPLGDAAAKIEFSISYEFASSAVGAALGPLFEYIADTMVDAFTRRAKALDGQDPR